mmetsp:Transcript_9757/g.14309  ORF Transcript_9757/g.14309 Transcript_9757/m.14309 type:complete len:337 (+) Transcript_9757:171-1181(+)|eukprot:CAMPEP_0194254332 /NCGR_PEP_ID=MMETSP0158-20130606/31902_1 /TAXON_ID=33649 /ORGANISM="Thalassionema nitzschioides, Strain L26-B" /LENGTH=336 /DNA_ID=CAMNT_0038992317 /DNA_START=81 /DNA_END=1091 /DNA_ORIENTATION=+
MRALVVAAFSLTLSLGAAVGLNLQKLSMRKEKEHGTKRPPRLQPLWCIGFMIQAFDACGDFIFIGLAPQSLLAPIGGLSLGFNVMLAPIFHPSEKVTPNVMIATALIYIGTILTILFAANTNPTYNLENLLTFVVTKLFIIYAFACICFQCTLLWHGRTYGYSIVHYCALAGSFGGECILFAKSTSELVKNFLLDQKFDDWVTSLIPYFFILGMIVTALSNVNFLNQGLDKFDALIVIPVYQSFWNAFGITGGLVFFQEYRYMSTNDGIMYALGISITLVGVSLLVRERSGGKRLAQRNAKADLETPLDIAKEGKIRQRRLRSAKEYKLNELKSDV